jgi:Protein of unknown function (DUF1091)
MLFAGVLGLLSILLTSQGQLINPSSYPLISFGQIEVTSYNYTFNPKANEVYFKIIVDKKDPANMSYELNVWNKVDMLTEGVTLEILTKEGPNSKTYEKSFAKTTINLCSLTSSLGSNVLRNFFIPTVSCSNLQFKCPFPKVNEQILIA